MDSVGFIARALGCTLIAVGGVSCGCICECEYKPGTITLQARSFDPDSLLEEKSFTFQRHVDWENLHYDSIQAFYYRHRTDSLIESRIILDFDGDYDMNCRKAKARQEQGWFCECDK